MTSDPTSSQPTQPLTDAELAQIREDYRGVDEYDSVPRLLAEVDRLRAENTARAERIYLVGTLTVPEGEWTRMFVAGYTAALKTVRFALGLDQDGGGEQ